VDFTRYFAFSSYSLQHVTNETISATTATLADKAGSDLNSLIKMALPWLMLSQVKFLNFTK